MNTMMKKIYVGIAVIAAAAGVMLFLAPRTGSENSEHTDRKLKVYELYNDYKKSFPDIREKKAEDLLALKESGQAVFIDVREPKEREVSTLPRAITEAELLAQIDKYRNQFLVAYCTIGYRSGKFAEKMEKKNLTVYNLAGGILGWVHAGGKVYAPDGSETSRVHVYGKQWNLLPENHQGLY